MAKSNSTRAADDKGLRQIGWDLTACRQTLMCAVEALGAAEDAGFEGEPGDLGVSAISVVRLCTKELVRIEERIDRLCMGVPIREIEKAVADVVALAPRERQNLRRRLRGPQGARS